MASNHVIAKKLLDLTKTMSANEIDNVARSIVKIYGNRSKTILRALLSKVQLANSSVAITSAKPIDETLKSSLMNAFGTKNKLIYFKVDKEIIGGIVVKVGDQILDNSLSTRLNAAKTLIIKAKVN